MTDSLPSAMHLQGCLERMRKGDQAARNELLQHVYERLQRLARKMLKGFPGVRRWEETDDVLQNALVRLLRALEDVRPTTLRDFFGLATEQLRRELLDLARHWFGPRGPGAHHDTHGSDAASPPYERADLSHEPALLAAWTELHEQMAALPDDEREVVGLLFYQELTQPEAASLLGVTVRTVQRRWQAALLKLHRVHKGQWPGE